MASTARGLRIINSISNYIKAYPESFDSLSVLTKINFVAVSDTKASAKFIVEPRMCNPQFNLHGGFISSIMDSMAIVAFLAHPKGKMAWTINMNLSLLNKASKGDEVSVVATTLKVSDNATVESKLINETTGRIIAKGLITLLPAKDEIQKLAEETTKLDLIQKNVQ